MSGDCLTNVICLLRAELSSCDSTFINHRTPSIFSKTFCRCMGRICERQQGHDPSSGRWAGSQSRSSQLWWKQTKAWPDPGSHRDTGRAPRIKSVSHEEKETKLITPSGMKEWIYIEFTTPDLIKIMYLKVLSVSRSGWNRHFLVPQNSVDGGTLSHVRISNLLRQTHISLTGYTCIGFQSLNSTS